MEEEVVVDSVVPMVVVAADAGPTEVEVADSLDTQRQRKLPPLSVLTKAKAFS